MYGVDADDMSAALTSVIKSYEPYKVTHSVTRSGCYKLLTLCVSLETQGDCYSSTTVLTSVTAPPASARDSICYKLHAHETEGDCLLTSLTAYN